MLCIMLALCFYKIPCLLSLMQKSIIGLVPELWSPGLLTEYIGMCFLPFAMLTIKMRRDCSHSGLEVGLSAFQLPTFAKWDALLKKESIPAITFWISKHPLPTRSFRFLRVTLCSALWLHHAHPFVAATAKDLSHAEKQRVWSWSCGLQDLLQCSDCALSCAMRLLQTNHNQPTLVEIELLATVGWKWGCQPFSCPCSQNVTHCRMEICSTCLSKDV